MAGRGDDRLGRLQPASPPCHDPAPGQPFARDESPPLSYRHITGPDAIRRPFHAGWLTPLPGNTLRAILLCPESGWNDLEGCYPRLPDKLCFRSLAAS
jgi:hypothetical protein